MIDIPTSMEGIYVTVGNINYSRLQIDVIYKRLLEGEPAQQTEDIDAVILGKLGHLWQKKPPYYGEPEELIVIRNIILNLGIRITNSISKGLELQRSNAKLQSRITGE